MNKPSPFFIFGVSAALLLSACGSGPATLSTPSGSDTLLSLSGLPQTLTLSLGQQFQAAITVNGQVPAAGWLTWRSSDPAVVAVTSGGLLRALKLGSAQIQISETTHPSRVFSLQIAVQPLVTVLQPSPQALGVWQQLNLRRQQGGSCGGVAYPAVPQLRWNSQLFQSAQAHADDMKSRNYFDHNSLDGRTFDQRISDTGYVWSSAAENIAAGQTSAAEVMAAWLASPAHCQNLFSAKVTEVGVGYTEGGSQRFYWVQDFGKPQ